VKEEFPFPLPEMSLKVEEENQALDYKCSSSVVKQEREDIHCDPEHFTSCNTEDQPVEITSLKEEEESDGSFIGEHSIKLEQSMEDDLDESENEETLDLEPVFGEPRPLEVEPVLVNPEPLVFYCDLCNYSVTRSHCLEKHIATVHKPCNVPRDLPMVEVANYPCKDCDLSFEDRALLRLHILETHREKRFPCDLCDYVSVSSSSLKRHQSIIHAKTRFPCDICEYSASILSKLKHHKLVKHEGLRFNCEKCEFTATTHSHLMSHDKNKHQGVRYPCNLCNYSATRRADLKKHKQSIHEGVRYSCDQCNFIATEKGHLTKHVKRHVIMFEDGQPKMGYYIEKVQCDQCDFATTSKSHLNQHKRNKHQGVRHPCDQCEYAATKLSDLTKHKNVKHLGIRYPCTECDYKKSPDRLQIVNLN